MHYFLHKMQIILLYLNLHNNNYCINNLLLAAPYNFNRGFIKQTVAMKIRNRILKLKTNM